MLKKLYIHNFKSFWNSTFEFGKVNCLIAPNNTGKSNLIEAIEFIDKLLFKTDDTFDIKKDFNELKNFKHEENNIKFTLEFELTNRVLVYYDLIDYKYSVKFNIILGNINNIDVEIDGYIKSLKININDNNSLLSQSFGSRLFDEELNTSIINYIEYDKELNKKRYSKFNFKYAHNTLLYTLESPSTIKDAIYNLFSIQVNTKNEIIKHIDFRNIFSKRIFSSHYFHTNLIKQYAQITTPAKLNKYGTNLVEFISGQLDKTIEDISTSMIGEVEQIDSIEIVEEAFKTLYFIENGKYKVPLKKASDGTIHYLAIMSSLIANEKNTIAIMFEEPERHLHLKLLITIVNQMRYSNSQIFFTTHSGELLKELNQDEIIFLYRDEDFGDTKSLNASKVHQLDKIFKKYKYEISDIVKDGVLGYIGDYDG
jgi:predicted ATPase